MGEICSSPGDNEVTVYGDYVDPKSRSLLNILIFSGIKCNFESVSKYVEKDKSNRDAFKKTHPVEFLPLLVHGNEKIASNIEQILMYLVKVFPQVNKHVFNDEK